MIICFSGTGNSAAVASRLSVLLDDESLVLLRGEILTGEKPALTLKGERIIWVFPTYSWGVPPVVADFYRASGNSGGRQCAAFHGDDMW